MLVLFVNQKRERIAKKVKIGFDCTMVLVSVITCLTCLHSLGSVGAGTVIAAVLVGTLVGVLNRAFGKRRDVIMGREEATAPTAAMEQTDHYVITISREFGSGGREIGELAQKGSCVIVGRLANYILKDMPTAYHVFISADMAAKAARVAGRDQVSEKAALAKIAKVDHERAVHCKHFTKTEWGNAKHYDLCIRSNDLGTEETASLIAGLFRRKMGL